MKAKAKKNGAPAPPTIRDLEQQIQELIRTVHFIDQARAHFDDQYECAPYGCLTLDSLGRILELNLTAAKLLGRDRARLVRMPLLPFVEKRSLPAYLQHLRCCNSRREKCVSEVALAVKGSARRLVELRSVPVEDARSGQTVYRTALLDVTGLKNLQREVIEIGEREQSRIGQDLHDGPCQTLIGAAILAEGAAREIAPGHPDGAARLREVARLVRDGADEVRRVAAGLFPVKVEREGLARALGDLAAESSARGPARCTFTMPRAIVIAELGDAIHLYRIAQEAVSNAMRHARACHIALELAQKRGGAIRLVIRDDGDGMPAQPAAHGLGLHTMRYRANMLGGSLEIAPATPRGTAVTCTYSRKEARHASSPRTTG